MHWILCMLANAAILFSLCKLLPTARTLFGERTPTPTTELYPLGNLSTTQTPLNSITQTSAMEPFPSGNLSMIQTRFGDSSPTSSTEPNISSNLSTTQTPLNSITQTSATKQYPSGNLPATQTPLNSITQISSTEPNISGNLSTTQTPLNSITQTSTTKQYPSDNLPATQTPLNSITQTSSTEPNISGNLSMIQTNVGDSSLTPSTEPNISGNLSTTQTPLNSITQTSATKQYPSGILSTTQTPLNSITQTPATKLSPVILVPGLGGSQLEAKLNRSTTETWYCDKKSSDYFHLWLDADVTTILFKISCIVDNMKLRYDNNTRTTSNQEGIDIRVPGWGDTLSVDYPAQIISYFAPVSNMLVEDLGYVRNVSLRGAPYDFRKGPSENQDYFLKLKDLIEDTYEMNNNQSVTLLAHSMGGPMSLVFLQSQSQAWKDKYINSLITLAASWGGSVRSLKVVAVGENLDIGVVSDQILREMLITFPSIGWLLPSKSFWGDEVLIETQTKNYTAADLQQYLIRIKQQNSWEFYEDNEKYLQDFSPPGVKLHCLYGSKTDTVEKLIYGEGKTMEDKPNIYKGEGDGYVNLKSLEGCTRWIGKQDQEIYNQTFPDVDHRNILESKEVHDYLKKVLKLRP